MLVFALISVFVSTSLLCYAILQRVQQARALKARLQQFSPEASYPVRQPAESSESFLKRLLTYLSSLIPANQAQKIQLQLERADLPLRASEFIVINLGLG